MSNDWDINCLIEQSASEIGKAAQLMSPMRGFSCGHYIAYYDLRGKVSAIDNLLFCFRLQGSLRVGLVTPKEDTLNCYIIVFPHMIFPSLNKKNLRVQTGLHHELAHILLKHNDRENYVGKISPAYFNQSIEMDAFFFQTLADLSFCMPKGKAPHFGRARDVLGASQSEFVQQVSREAIPQFWKALYPENRQKIKDRAADFWRYGKKMASRYVSLPSLQ